MNHFARSCILVASMVVACVLPLLVVVPPGQQAALGFHHEPLRTSAPSRHAPMNITCNANYSALAVAGDGSAGNPWIIEDFLIECNSSGSGIIVTGADDHVIFRDGAVNESGAGPTDCNLFINASNVEIRNVTCQDSNSINAAIAGVNVTLNASTFIEAAGTSNVFFTNSTNVLVVDCIIGNSSGSIGVGYEVAFDSTYGSNDDVTFERCNFTCDTGNGGLVSGAGDLDILQVDSCIMNLSTSEAATLNDVNVTITNCTTIQNLLSTEDVISLQDCAYYLIQNCTFTNNTLSDPGVCLRIGASNGTITGCEFLGPSVFPDIYLAIPMAGDAYCNITWNNFTTLHVGNYASIWLHDEVFIDANKTHVTIENNFVHHRSNLVFAYWTSLVERPDVTLQHNYYREYFDLQPVDVTVNLSTTVLESPVNVTGPGGIYYQDDYPEYYAAWFERSESVFLQFDSGITGEEIFFGNLKVYKDNTTQITTTAMLVEHVLFRLTVYDSHMNLYLDAMYNFNDTGIYLAINLSIVPQVFFAYWSSIDWFGLENIVKLYIDGQRITRLDPTMLPEVIHVELVDNANMSLYDQVLNLSVTGIYLDISLLVAPVLFTNNYTETILVYLTRGNSTAVFPIAPSSGLLYRLGTGDYDYQVTSLDGEDLEDGSWTVDAADPASFAVIFGNVTVTPPGLMVNPNSLIVAVIVTVGILGGTLTFAAVFRRKKQSSKPKYVFG